jgi:hypothetical protein
MDRILAQPTSLSPWRQVFQTGAGIAIGLTFAYALAFAAYAIFRVSLTVWTMTPTDISLFRSLTASATSITLAAMASALLQSLLTVLLGCATAALIKGLLASLNRQRNGWRAILIGLGSALLFVLVYQLTAQRLMGQPLYNLGVETYTFWFGLPGLIHIGAGIAGAWHLNRQAARKKVASNPT